MAAVEEIAEKEKAPPEGKPEAEEEEENEEEEELWTSDSDVGDALDYLDSKDNDRGVEGGFTINSRRPNAHGGLHSRPASLTLQPLANRNQKFTTHIRASPLEEWEGRLNVGMSNSVTTAIRGSVRDMAIGRTKTTEKADCATVEQAKGQWRKSGWAAPRLKDAALSLDKLREGYMEMIIAMRTMYQKSKLVHGDLSEYNILYFEGHLYIIDVSQAVDLDHPHALDFLREDCVHVSDFFRKHGVAVMTIRELFDFIVDPTIADDAVEGCLDMVQGKVTARGDISAEEEIADSVFVQSYIPKTLDDVKNAERDVIRLTSGEDTGDMYYKTITGLKEGLPQGQPAPSEKEQQQDAEQSENPETESNSDTDDENSSDSEGQSSSSETQAQAARKENKNKVKEEKREARKN